MWTLLKDRTEAARGFTTAGRLLLVACAVALTSCGGGADRPVSTAAPETMVKRTSQSDVISSGATIGGLTKVSERRISRTVYEYTFQVSVTSSAPKSLMAVVATLTSVGAGASIVDGKVAVGYLPAGATVVPTDTITIQQDRTVAFQPSAFVWTITGMQDLDRGNSVAGTDADANGVRDDIDRVITRSSVSSEQKQALLQVARAYQQMLAGAEVTATALAIDRAQACLASRTSDYANLARGVFAITVNTEARFNAFLSFESSVGGIDVPEVTGNPCDI